MPDLDLKEKIPADFRKAVAGGLVAAVIAALGVGTTGIASGAEARALLDSTLPTIRFLSSAVITASATIMALMLTILSLSRSADSSFRERHYERVRKVATWCTIAIIGATVQLLFLSVPTAESEVLSRWYEPIYYAIVLTSSCLGGIQVAVILMLHETISGMVAAVHPELDSHLVVDEDEDEG